MPDGGSFRRSVNNLNDKELLSCPFCGSTNVGFYEYVYAQLFAVMCNLCGAEGPRRSTQEEAAKLWNRRARD